MTRRGVCSADRRQRCRPGAMVSAAPRGSPATAALLQATAGAGSAVAVAFALHPLELTKTRRFGHERRASQNKTSGRELFCSFRFLGAPPGPRTINELFRDEKPRLGKVSGFPGTRR
ncbi:unnamed protein product [Prorocentrum cordatum]|uniref:Uncharacterized protein n=1 Tax=Prorocentrum cordatum TaxID=2364126 RepID=A0ABN9PIF0_9DINO|nr:unnamed protein product [Polarella glacialis]